MKIIYLVMLFFIKILPIIPNTLYIAESMFIDDKFINLDWLKEAVLSNDNIIISPIGTENNAAETDYEYRYTIKNESNSDDDHPTEQVILESYKRKLKYKYLGVELLKINIDDASNLQNLIENIKSVNNKKIDLHGNLIELDNNIKKVNCNLEVYKYSKDKYYSYGYVFSEEGGFKKEIKYIFPYYDTDNPTILKRVGSSNCIFFSYFNCNNKGIFENSKIKAFRIISSLSDYGVSFEGLFRNSSIKSIDIMPKYSSKSPKCNEMFLNCKRLESLILKNAEIFYGNSIFENCENLRYCYDTYDKDKIKYIPIKKNMFKNCEKIKFYDDVQFVINNETEDEDMEDVFYNVENEDFDRKIYLKIEENTNITVMLDKIFNNHKLEEIIIEDNSDSTILGTKELLKTGTLKKIRWIKKKGNEEEKEYILDLKNEKLMKYFKEVKNVDDIIERFFEAAKIVNDNIEKFYKLDEEKRKQENNGDIDNQNIDNQNIVKPSNTICFFCCVTCSNKLCKIN